MELDLDLGAHLDFVIGKHADAIAKKLAPHKPILNRAVAATTFGGSGETFLDLGSPAVGRVWEVTSMCVYGVDDNTVLANVKVALYFGDTFVPSMSSLCIPGVAVPSFTDVGDETLYCEASANIVAGITGTGNGNVGVNITYKDWPESAIAARNGATMR
jgi:hypothetical protein